MNDTGNENRAVIPAPSAALARAGPAALAMRGLRDLLAAQQADALFKKGVELWAQREYTEAVGCFRHGLEYDTDHPALATWLGTSYCDGLGVTQDDEKAVYWLQKAAERGCARAQSNLGAMYGRGQGVSRDHRQAVAWYRKAAEQSDACAEHNLGLAYANGHGVAQDYTQAAFWYRKAAEQGEEQAQHNLGLLY